MQRPDMIRLMHMLDAARYAWDFVAGRARGDLDTDRMLQFALVRAVEIIGEAASQISAAGQAELSTFPWRDVIGMRNRLIHAYFNINLDTLWETANVDIPRLIAEIEQYISATGPSTDEATHEG